MRSIELIDLIVSALSECDEYQKRLILRKERDRRSQFPIQQYEKTISRQEWWENLKDAGNGSFNYISLSPSLDNDAERLRGNEK